MINHYRWSIIFYHYLLNVIKLSNWKKKQTDLAIHCCKKKLPEKLSHELSHVLSLLGPSILLGRSAKKLECDKGKLNEEIGSNYVNYGINKSSIKGTTCYLNIIWLNIWAFRKFSSIGGRFYGSCVYWKTLNASCWFFRWFSSLKLLIKWVS